MFSKDPNKIAQQSNIRGNTLAASKEKCKSLGNINDILIVQKITEVDSTNATASEKLEANECLCFETTCDCEKKLFAEEQDAIFRKQLQMLQANERGKQALISEIAALRQSQEQRAELIRNRQRARDIENERAKRIASLPPPLPKSVKSLLKKYDEEPKTNKPEVQMPDELKTLKMKPIESNKENKENMLDPEELEARQKLQEEWQIKAQKRFNEALRKDRQKEEYSNIMKQIQNAELQNRRKMARNVSSDKEGIPCPLSDKFQISKRQADMEEAAEKMFKKISTKEHAIEDVEGYQDHYEVEYKRIDSNYESKMIDCVPTFVKENYEYLLEDESKFEGGKNFSELSESNSDVLNQAYIESPPCIDEFDGSEKIDLAISHLDKIRSNLQTEYEQTVKPLLMAAIEVPKTSDKAVETELVKLPAEDKAVETDMQFETELTSPSPSPIFDFKTAGVMAYKRRLRGPILSSYRELNVPDMRQRNVHYVIPTVTHSESLATGSWSSSSYCSLPSKHGIPILPNETKSMKCDICIAERREDFIKEVPPEPSSAFANCAKQFDKATISSKKASLSEYVQQLAEKYLIAKSSASVYTRDENVPEIITDSVLAMDSKTNNVTPAFEKEAICKSKVGLFVQKEAAKELAPTLVKESILENAVSESSSLSIKNPNVIIKEKISTSNSVETSVKTNEIHQDKTRKEHLKDDVYDEIKNYELSKSPVEYSDYDLEAKRIQAIQQVLSRRIPCFTFDLSPKPTEVKELEKDYEPESATLLMQNRMGVKPHVYHELSTIQELDSALTAGSIHLSHSKLSDTSENKGEKEPHLQEKTKEDLALSAEGLKIVSLLDPPDSEISDLAKSIQFVELQDKTTNPLEKSLSSEGLNTISTSSKDYLSTPSNITDSDSSVPSHGKIFSSTLSGNRKHPFLKDIGGLSQYFKDVSAIQQKASDSEKSSSSVPLSEFIQNLPVSCSSQSSPSVIHKSINKDNTSISGYISNKGTSEIIKSGIPHSTQENAHAVESGCISNIEVSETFKSDISHPVQKKEDPSHSLMSGYLKKIETPNVSNCGTFFPMTPCSDVSSSGVSGFGKNMKETTPAKNYILDHSSESNGDFKPMTPHSNISSPNEFTTLTHKCGHPNYSTSTESFKALTPHSNISTPSELTIRASQYEQDFVSSTESFKALTPHSNISSPSELAFHAPQHGQQGFTSSTESFKALTPHSNISSPRELGTHPSKYEHQANTRENFRGLTPHSDISSPGEFSENCRVLTPKSVVTYPSSHYGESEFEHKKNSGSSEFHPIPMTPRFHASTSSLSTNIDNQLTKLKSLSHISYLALKAQISKSPKNVLVPKMPGKKQMMTNNEDIYLNEPKDNTEVIRKKVDESQKRAYLSPSDFFIPHVSKLPDSKTKDDCDLVKDTLSGDCKEKASKLKSTYSSENKETLLESSGTAFSSSSGEILAKSIKEKPVSEISKEVKNQNLPNLDIKRGFKKKYTTLQVVSSSSSTENLSEISESKVLYQSTPIKNFSEIIQEPGIMEEPDLTLYTTNVSCKIGSPMKKRDPLTPSPIVCNDNTITPSQNECRTPVSQSQQVMVSADTPSMLSFLHHEMSCLQAEDDRVHSSAVDLNKTPNLPESKVSEKEVKRSLFQKSDYKQRTKRLWSNLEEVRKRNLEEERKRIMEANRLKAKKFAKKLTPRRKRN